MKCPACDGEVAAGRRFCARCRGFVFAPGVGHQAGLFARAAALGLDLAIGSLVVAGPPALAWGLTGPFSGELWPILFFVGLFGYGTWLLALLSAGKTPGKLMLGLRVVDGRTGSAPGFARMLIRDLAARPAGAALLGIGFAWAALDKDGQALHDKLVRTVVVTGPEPPRAEMPKSEEPAAEVPASVKEAVRKIASGPHPVASTGAGLQLRLVGGRASPDWLVPGEAAVFFGRRKENTIVLEDAEASRFHAKLAVRDGHAAIEDLGSQNGLHVNGVRLSFCRLKPGDVVELGATRWLVEPRGQPGGG